MENIKYEYKSKSSELWNLGQKQSMTMLFQALDSLEEPILIVNKETEIIYVNGSYLTVFASGFEKMGIPDNKIIGSKLMDLQRQEMEPILKVFKDKKPKLKLYSTNTTTLTNKMTSFSDIIPLKDNGELKGAIVILRNITQIVEMSHEMNKYKAIARELKKELELKSKLPLPFQSVVGSSPLFLALLRTSAQVAKSNASVCLTGESGTGKEVLATAIHYSSNYASGPFVKVNCAAIPETLLESELFGYEGGAFTGANPKGAIGKFELANGGTLLLDEIGEMPLPMQVKLLRVIQEHEITKVGGDKPIKLDFRLITATNKNLEDLVKNGEFREDLYYRISVIPLNVLPLRERRSDITILAEHFLHEFQEQYGGNYSFSSEILNSFEKYNWPGNIRELRNCVERAMVLSTNDIISTDVLPVQINSNIAHKRYDEDGSLKLQTILDKTERDAIEAALNITKGNRAQAIKILGISKRNFYMKMDKYGFR